MMRSMLIARHPSLGACFEDLLSTRFLTRRWTGRIWSVDDLPTRLQRCVRNLKPDCEWRAYGDVGQIFFSIARLRDPESATASAPSLEVFFLDSNAAVYCAGVWERDPAHGWWLDSLVDLSYDCEHGWWLDTVIDTKNGFDDVSQVEKTMRLHARDASRRAGRALPVKASS